MGVAAVARHQFVTAASLRIRTLQTRRELEALAADWDTLGQARQDPLLSHRWFAAAATALHADGSLHVIELRRDERLVGIAPLAHTRRHGVNCLEIIGAATLHEPTALLAASEPAAQALCETLVAARRPFMLQRIPMDSGVLGRLSECAKGRGTLLVARSAPCQRVDISGSWDDYLADRSSQVRSGLKRKRATLEQIGPVSFELLRPKPAELPAILEEAVAIEADGWKDAAGSSLRRNDALRHFIRELAGRFAADNALRVCFLRVAGRGVAMSILLEHDQCYWEIKIGYRESVSRASPGRLLLWETLRDAFHRGLRRYEFLGSGDGQQPDWATGSTALHSLVYYPWTPAGIWALAMDAGSRVLRRLKR